MLFIITAIIGIVIGIAMGGKLSNFLEFRIKKMWLIIFAFAALTIARLAGVRFQWINDYTMLIHGFVYIVLFVAIWTNRHYKGILLVGIGSFLNALVMMFNDGRMPVSANVADKAGIAYDTVNMDIRHVVFDKGTEISFPYLADIIYLPGVLGYGMWVVSIGDLIIALGFMLMIIQIVKGDSLQDEI